MSNEILDLLQKPFAPYNIEWRVGRVSQKGTALALAYVTARTVQDRLDHVLGFNWSSSLTETRSGRILSSLTVRDGDKTITRTDGAGATAVEGEKGGISDALKRSAVSYGVARYVYGLPSPWVPIDQNKEFTQQGLTTLTQIANKGTKNDIFTHLVSDEHKRLLKLLQAPFHPDEVEWRVGRVNKETGKGNALAYVDARTVQNRLDEVFGLNWSSSVKETDNGLVLCTISLQLPNGEVSSRTDGAGNTKVEGDKGGISDALKRSAVTFGVGRYLYRLDSPEVDLTNTGKYAKITRESQDMLDALTPVQAKLKTIEKVQHVAKEKLGDDWATRINKGIVAYSKGYAESLDDPCLTEQVLQALLKSSVLQ